MTRGEKQSTIRSVDNKNEQEIRVLPIFAHYNMMMPRMPSAHVVKRSNIQVGDIFTLKTLQ